LCVVAPVAGAVAETDGIDLTPDGREAGRQ
jgi:hypothetical protein